ncbi:unnamed protein product [Withania somnifera]
MFPLAHLVTANCFVNKQYHVEILDDLPPDSPQLKIHCASKEDELGEHFLSSGKDFTWSFCEQFFNRTLYFCHFWWGTKETAFEVFNDIDNCIHDGPDIGSNKCVWVVKQDGFYLGYYDHKKGDLIDYLIYVWPN